MDFTTEPYFSIDAYDALHFLTDVIYTFLISPFMLHVSQNLLSSVIVK
jgi:hypothetical protein